MKHFTIHEAKTHLSRLIQSALKGERIIIGKGKEALVELKVLSKARGERIVGDYRGRIRLSDSFNDLLPDFKDYQ